MIKIVKKIRQPIKVANGLETLLFNESNGTLIIKNEEGTKIVEADKFIIDFVASHFIKGNECEHDIIAVLARIFVTSLSEPYVIMMVSTVERKLIIQASLYQMNPLLMNVDERTFHIKEFLQSVNENFEYVEYEI